MLNKNFKRIRVAQHLKITCAKNGSDIFTDSPLTRCFVRVTFLLKILKILSGFEPISKGTEATEAKCKVIEICTNCQGVIHKKV